MLGGVDSRLSTAWDRIRGCAAIACATLLAGAGLGFLARDLLGLGQPAVALAWLAGVVLVLGSERARGGRRE